MPEIQIRLAVPSDLEALVDLETRAMHFPMGHRVREWFRDDYPGEIPVAVVEHNGRLVSAAALVPLRILYRGVPLEAAYWEAVVTDEAHRRQGLCRRLFEFLTPAEGLDALFVWGATWMYRRFGYHPAIRNHGGLDSAKRVVRVSDLPAATLGVRSATADDAPFLSLLHRESGDRYVVSVPVSETKLRYDLHRDRRVVERGEIGLNKHQEWRILTREGKPVGYFMHDPWDLACLMELEIVPGRTTWQEAGATAVRATADFPERPLTPGEVPTTLPTGHPLYAAYPRTFRPPTRPFGDNAARIPNPAAFLLRIAPALERCLAASSYASWTGELTLSLIEDGMRLRFTDGRLTEAAPRTTLRPVEARVRLMPGRFEALAFGYRSIGQILDEDADCATDEESEGVLTALFPSGDSFLRPI